MNMKFTIESTSLQWIQCCIQIKMWVWGEGGSKLDANRRKTKRRRRRRRRRKYVGVKHLANYKDPCWRDPDVESSGTRSLPVHASAISACPMRVVELLKTGLTFSGFNSLNSFFWLLTFRSCVFQISFFDRPSAV